MRCIFPITGPIVTNGSQVIYNNLDDEGPCESQAKVGKYGSVRCHNDEVHGEGEVYKNDLTEPPSDQMHKLSLPETLNQLSSKDNSVTYIKKLNVKLDMNSNLNRGSVSRDKDDLYERGKDVVDDDKSCASSSCTDDDSDIDDSFDLQSYNEGGTQTTRTLKLYNYQLELAENALAGSNTIICAETGTGKTFVAFHIIQEHLKKPSPDPRKIVFMARTVILVKQQYERFTEWLPQFSAKLLTGEDEQCRMLHMFMMQPYDIIFLTPQILVNNLDDKKVKSLSEFSLLLLDECHHTRGDEPFKRLMRRYLVEKFDGKKDLPQIVGLTATIGVGKSNTEDEAEDYILGICANLDVDALSTVEKYKDELQLKTNKPEEEVIPLRVVAFDPCRDIIIAAMDETEQTLNAKVCMEPNLIDLVHHKQPGDKESQKYNKWTVEVINEAEKTVRNPATLRDICACARHLHIYNSAMEINKLLTSGEVIKYIASKHKVDSENEEKLTTNEKTLLKRLKDSLTQMMTQCRQRENPNVRILSDKIRTTIDAKGEDSRALVFVKARATCRALAECLNRDLEKSAVRASPLLGQGERGGEEGMTGQEQQMILEQFESGDYKIVVCTSVANEGVSIPNCNIVISYEYSGNEIASIQMKGRARKPDSKTIAIGSEKHLARERMNAYKAYIMYRAMARVTKMDPKVFQRKIALLQNKEIRDFKYKLETVKMKEYLKTDENYQILCKRCGTFLCYVSEVRLLLTSRIVIRKDFCTKIERYLCKHPKVYEGLEKKYKMRCKNCPEDLGNITVVDVWECPVFKFAKLKFINLRTNQVEKYKSWTELPCKITKISKEDLPGFFA